ncbi:MAG: hypothetical protein V1802_00285 [Candidatus Aenigmatarchaeota archaeon]
MKKLSQHGSIRTISEISAVIAILVLAFVTAHPAGGSETEQMTELQKENSAAIQVKYKIHEPTEFFGPEPAGMKVNKNNAERISRDFLSKKKNAFGINDIELVLNSVKERLSARKETVYFIDFIQIYKGIPVYGSGVTVYIQNDKIAFTKSDYYQDIDVPTKAKISWQAADEIVKNDLTKKEEGKISEILQGYYDFTGKFRKYNFSKISRFQETAKELVVYPFNDQYYLAWKIDLPPIREVPLQLTVFVDASNGKIINAVNNIAFYDIFGTVSGKEWESSPTTGLQLQRFFSHNYVLAGGQRQETDEGGSYEFTELVGAVSFISRLEGPWVKVINAQLPSSNHSLSIKQSKLILDNGMQIDWSWAQDDNSYLDEESNAFYHVNHIHDYAVSIGATEMNFQMPTYVNINDVCNGYYNGWSINLLKKGVGGPFPCENTALISDVIYHEYGHAINQKLNPSIPIGSIDQGGAIQEGMADYWACTLNNDPNVNEGFYSGLPAPLRNCSSDNKYPDDYLAYNPHYSGMIVSGTLWDIREVLGQEYFDRLLVNAMRLKPKSFIELPSALLIADDNDADLSDETPNFDTICDSFFSHGIVSPSCTPNIVKNPSLEIDNGTDYYPSDGWEDAVANNSFPDGWASNPNMPVEKKMLEPPINDVICNGNNQYGQSENYTVGDAKNVSAGGFHTCVLLTGGNVTCYGWNSDGQVRNYTGGDAIAVSAGKYHTCVLKSNGNVDCYGYNHAGQSNDYLGGDAIAVSAGYYHTCVLKLNHNVDCYGDNTNQQANDYLGGDAVAVAAGWSHTCVLKSNGNVHCYGTDTDGQLIDYTAGDAIAVAASTRTCILKSNGNVKCYGHDEGWPTDYLVGDAVGLAVGHLYTCVLKSNHNVDCNGDNSYGKSEDYTLGDAIGVSAGYSHKCVLKTRALEGDAIKLTGDSQQNYIKQDIPVRLNNKYEVSGWIKSELTTGLGMIGSQCVDANHNHDWESDCGLNVDPGVRLTGNQSWTNVKFNVTANKPDRLLRVVCTLLQNSVGNIWCDNFSVKRIS